MRSVLGLKKFLWLLKFCCLLLYSNVSFAQQQRLSEGRYEEKNVLAQENIAEQSLPIEAIRFEGLRHIEPEAALRLCRLQVGKIFHKAIASEDIHAMWSTGFFKDIRLEKERGSQGGVVLLYIVSEKPSIRKIVFEGQDNIGLDDIKEVVDIKTSTILNTENLQKNVRKIKDLYVSKGYYLVEVEHRIQEVPEKNNAGEKIQKGSSLVDVIFHIRENAKIMVRQIQFLGNHHLSSESIKAVLQTREGDELSFLSQSGTFKEEYFQTDLLRLQALYYDHGFVSVKVSQPQAVMSKDHRYIYITIPIEEGPQYRLGCLNFTGDVLLHDSNGQLLADEAILKKHVQLEKKSIFSRSKLFEQLQLLSDIYRDAGYAYANVTPNTHVNEDSLEIDVDFDVDRGDLVFIERIDIAGNLRTRDKVIRRELMIMETDLFSAAAVNLSKARVYQLGFFESVEITTNRGESPNRIVVTIDIKEKSTGTFQMGAGINSLESFLFTAQISQDNFLGHGQKLSFHAQLSFGTYARQLINLEFYEPYLLDTFWSLGFNGYIQQRYYRDFQRHATGISPRLGYPLNHEWRLSAGYTLEHIRVAINDDIQSVLYNLNRSGRVSAVQLTLSYDNRDNRLFPQKGLFYELRSEWASPWIGAEKPMSYSRLETDLRFYRPLGLGFILRGNAQLGWIFGSPGGVPLSERYYPGGIYSVRGFAPRGLGPSIRVPVLGRDPKAGTREFFVGGTKQAIFNLEIEFNIVPAAGVKGVIFTDAGNAFRQEDNMFDIATADSDKTPGYWINTSQKMYPFLGLFYSVGFGIRWQSPMGPLRFEWGIPVVKREPDAKPIIFEFSIGNFF